MGGSDGAADGDALSTRIAYAEKESQFGELWLPAARAPTPWWS